MAGKTTKKPSLTQGDGSIKWVEKRQKWEYRKRITLPDGTKKDIYVYGKTPSECKSLMPIKEKEKIEEFNQDKEPSSKIVLCEAMYKWLETVKKPTLKSQSYDRLEKTIRNQIEYSDIGYLRYQTVTTDDIQTLISNLNEKHMSYSVIKKTYDALNAFYRYVSAKDKIDNPMLLVVMPTQANTNHEARDVVWFEEEDIELFIEECHATWNTGNPKYQGSLAYGANIYEGLRIGELLALQWQDIDFEKNLISVTKTLIEKKNPNYDPNDPTSKKVIFEIQNSNKTSKNRKVVILDEARKLLLEHKMKSNFTEPMDYVISTKNRRTTTPKNADDTIKSIQKNARTTIQKASTHTLRHTCASLMFKAGVPIEMIAKHLGNSVEVCRKTYVHFAEKDMENVAQMTGEYMNKSLIKLQEERTKKSV